MSIVNEHLGKLKRRQVELICLSQDIVRVFLVYFKIIFNVLFLKERNVDNVKTAKDERFREIRNIMQTMQVKLEEQFNNKLDVLNGRIKKEVYLVVIVKLRI